MRCTAVAMSMGGAAKRACMGLLRGSLSRSDTARSCTKPEEPLVLQSPPINKLPINGLFHSAFNARLRLPDSYTAPINTPNRSGLFVGEKIGASDPDAGALGAITSDPQTATDLKATLANLRHVSEQLADEKGMIGAMINDEDLAIRFRRILNQVSRAIEDAREAAPISNFVQVLLGVF